MVQFTLIPLLRDNSMNCVNCFFISKFFSDELTEGALSGGRERVGKRLIDDQFEHLCDEYDNDDISGVEDEVKLLIFWK